MSEIPSLERMVCDGTARSCTSKLGKLVTCAESTNAYTAGRLDEFAHRQRSLATETTVRIGSMAESAGIDYTDLEDPKAMQSSADHIELKIAELAVDRAIATVACEGAKLFGRCGAYLTEK